MHQPVRLASPLPLLLPVPAALPAPTAGEAGGTLPARQLPAPLPAPPPRPSRCGPPPDAPTT